MKCIVFLLQCKLIVVYPDPTLWYYMYRERGTSKRTQICESLTPLLRNFVLADDHYQTQARVAIYNLASYRNTQLRKRAASDLKE